MIRGIGTDIVQISRLKDTLIHKILTRKEIELYNSFQSSERKKEFYAGRFAAKEAIIKAITSPELIISFQDITILPDIHGKPIVDCLKAKGVQLLLSISHERDYAVAFCVCETLNL